MLEVDETHIDRQPDALSVQLLRLIFILVRLQVRRARRLVRRSRSMLRRARRTVLRARRTMLRRGRRMIRRLGGVPRRARARLRRYRGRVRVLRRRMHRIARLAQRRNRRAGRAVQRAGRRSAARTMSRVRPRVLAAVKKVLRPWHRITLFHNFWNASTDIVMAWGPDVVHSCDLEGLVSARRVSRALRVPHVHDCHELFLERLQFSWMDKALLSRIEHREIRGADVITVVNKSIGDEYARRFGVQSVVVRNCADRPATIVRRDVRGLAGLPADVDVVLYQGGLQGGRGLHEVVRSAQWLPSGAFLVFLGYGPLRDELEELTRDLGLDERVRFVEAVPPDELLGVTASATVGIVPYQPVSLNNKLSLPNKIFEYLTVGLPVVVSDVPELRRIVEESACGRTYNSFDPRSLATAVNEVLSPEVRAPAAAAALAYGDANTWHAEQLILHRIYDGLLSRRH